MHRGNSDLAQRLIKRKVSIRHSLDTSIQTINAQTGSTLNVTHSSADTNHYNPYFGSIYNSRRSANSETNIGSITLATATGSTPAIKLEVCSILPFDSLLYYYFLLQTDFNAIIEDSHKRQHDFFGSPYTRQRPKLTLRSEPSRSFPNSFDSNEDLECFNYAANTNNGNDLDNSIFASEIAAVMSSADNESQPGSGLVTEIGSMIGSHEFLADIEYIDENSKSESLESGTSVPRIISSYVDPPEYYINEGQDYSSGQFLLVPDQCGDGGDSECEFSTQTVIRVPGKASGQGQDDDTDSNDSDILEDSSDCKQLIHKHKGRRRDSANSKCSSKLEFESKDRFAYKPSARRQSTKSVTGSDERHLFAQESQHLFPYNNLSESLHMKPIANSKSFTSITSNKDQLDSTSKYSSSDSQTSNNLASQSIFNFVRSENVLYTVSGDVARTFSPSPGSYASSYERSHEHHHAHFRHHSPFLQPLASHPVSAHVALIPTANSQIASSTKSSQIDCGDHCQARLYDETDKSGNNLNPTISPHIQVSINIADNISVPVISSANNNSQLQSTTSSSQLNNLT